MPSLVESTQTITLFISWGRTGYSASRPNDFGTFMVTNLRISEPAIVNLETFMVTNLRISSSPFLAPNFCKGRQCPAKTQLLQH
jgi:hypothetical protein